LIPAMTNHPKDRHVLAAAAHASVKVIVTYNIKDIPRSSLTPYSITAQGPSAFLEDLYAAAHLRRYQAERGKAVGACQLDGEMSVLQMILKESGQWDRITKFYKPMRMPKRRGGHSISADEERVLREVAFSKPKWSLAAH
jgi:hypothetical protein